MLVSAHAKVLRTNLAHVEVAGSLGAYNIYRWDSALLGDHIPSSAQRPATNNNDKPADAREASCSKAPAPSSMKFGRAARASVTAADTRDRISRNPVPRSDERKLVLLVFDHFWSFKRFSGEAKTANFGRDRFFCSVLEEHDESSRMVVSTWVCALSFGRRVSHVAQSFGC